METNPNFAAGALRMGLKKMVLKECNVLGVTVDEIADEDRIIAGPGALRLDSLDAVEIVTALERHFDIRLDTVGAARSAFKSFATMSDYVVKNAKQEKIDSFLASQN